MLFEKKALAPGPRINLPEIPDPVSPYQICGLFTRKLKSKKFPALSTHRFLVRYTGQKTVRPEEVRKSFILADQEVNLS